LKTITLGGIGTRFLFAFALVCLTWNPTRYNYCEWAVLQWANIKPLVAFAGVGLLIGWIVFLRTTLRSLGALGIFLTAALLGTAFWILVFYGLVDKTNSDLLAWIIMVLLAVMLAAGMSWSHLRRGWSGQVDVDDRDEN
jgi:Family of unknown function (DUF6524)